jgi:hypothetical protein
MWELWSLGRTPYPSFTNIEVVDKVVEGYRMGCPDICPAQMHALMLLTWHQDPESRPTFAEIEQVRCFGFFFPR